MREQITMYRDMYEFYKDTKSKKLFIAFAEYLFEWIEPTDLKWIEKTIFNSLKIRMENQRKKAGNWAKWWSTSHWWWRPWNASSELKQETSKKQANEQAKNKEDNNTNVLLLSRSIITSNDVIVDESTEWKKYEKLYEAYPYKDKWIDKETCDKLIDKQLKQWATLEWMLKEMKLEELELRVKQWDTHRYWRKLEKWLREYVEWMADSEDRLKQLLLEHCKRLENWPRYRKNPRDELCNLFWTDCVKRLFMETKQWVRLFTT